jgi:hypothetical protein
MRMAVVGAGIAGALLAWRLPGARVELFTGSAGPGPDATGASGGLVRAFETDPAACRLAAASMAELHADPLLAGWADYREIGSVHLLPAGSDPDESVRIADRLVPGSVSVLEHAELSRRFPFRDLPDGTLGVVERRAGYVSPGRLRDRVLTDVLARESVLHSTPVDVVTTDPAVRLADGTTRGFDAVIVAAGAHTPQLLARSGLPVGGLRTRQIQYSVHTVRLPGLGAFVDDTTGLYGRPDGPFAFLLGLPSDRWDVEPAAVVAGPTPALVECAARRLGVSLSDGLRRVASSDCYHRPPGLALRPVVPGSPLFTFTGGSGGAAKNALAASRRAAATWGTPIAKGSHPAGN